MPVERGRVELCQAVDLCDVAVDAIADRDVDQAVVGTQRHSRLSTLLGQGVQARASATTKDYAQYSLQQQCQNKLVYDRGHSHPINWPFQN